MNHLELCNVHECMYVSVFVSVCVSVRQCAFSPWVLTQINDLWNRDAGSTERFQQPVEYREESDERTQRFFIQLEMNLKG